MMWQVSERNTENNLAVKNTFANGVLFEDGTMVITITTSNLHRTIEEANADPLRNGQEGEPWGWPTKISHDKAKELLRELMLDLILNDPILHPIDNLLRELGRKETE